MDNPDTLIELHRTVVEQIFGDRLPPKSIPPKPFEAVCRNSRRVRERGKRPGQADDRRASMGPIVSHPAAGSGLHISLLPAGGLVDAECVGPANVKCGDPTPSHVTARR